MNSRKSIVLSIAIALSPRDKRDGRNEQWRADLRDAQDLGIPRWTITSGALVTAVTSARKRAGLAHGRIAESENIMKFRHIQSRPSATKQIECVTEAQALLDIVDQAVPLVESAEALIAKVGTEARPTSDDAREGLRIRQRFASLLSDLNDLGCCQEHAIMQVDAAKLFTFYLHMITRSFEVRFSTLGRTEYEISKARSAAPTRYARLLGLRASLVEFLESLPELRLEDLPSHFEPPKPQEADQRVLHGLALAGLMVVVLSIATVVWQSSAAQGVSFTCGDLGCQASDPGLYFLTTAALLFAPTLLAAGAIAAVISFGMTRLLVSARLYRKTPKLTGAFRALIWAPGIVLTAVSSLALVYISQPSTSPGALCVAGTCTDEYAFTVILHSVAPAGLLTGSLRLLIAALSWALPHANPAPRTNDDATRTRSDLEERVDVSEPKTRPLPQRTDLALFRRPTEGPHSDEG